MGVHLALPRLTHADGWGNDAQIAENLFHEFPRVESLVE